jgi:hypothetical protein
MKLYLVFTFFLSCNLWANWNPQMVFFSPADKNLKLSSPKINYYGDILVKIKDSKKNQEGLWLKRGGQKEGQVVFQGQTGEQIGTPSFNSDAQIIFGHNRGQNTLGIKIYGPQTGKVFKVVGPSDDPRFFQLLEPTINDVQEIVFQAIDKKGKRYIVTKGKEGHRIVEEEGQEISQIHTPSMNNLGHIAVKVTMNDQNRSEEIRLYHNIGGNSVVTQNFDPFRGQQYLSFDHGVSLSSSNYLVYVATNLEGKKEILVHQGKRKFLIAKEGQDNLTEIENVTPKVNSFGEVIFRAITNDGKRNVFVYSNKRLLKLVSEGDQLPCQLEEPCFVSKDDLAPSLLQAPDFNDWGEAVLNISLSDGSLTKRIGHALYKFSQLKAKR